MNEVESSRDIVHNPSPLMTRLAIMWHDNRRFFLVLEMGGRCDPTYDAIYLPTHYVYGTMLPTFWLIGRVWLAGLF